ncbi:MAG TPA: urease subunit gamma [Nitrososphaera sp.]|nr:urease subunit gamma [Nitrososphaera sp.]
MIRVKATIRGEPDVPSFTTIFDYDENIFFSSSTMIEEKIQQKMKINANEALMAYCAYVVKSIRAGKKDADIRKGASEILSVNNVMIGVPETLQAIIFEVALENKTRKIAFKEPIPTSSYIMSGH